MSDASARYEIRTVADFFRVPSARRDVLLREFGVWMEMNDAIRELLGDMLKNYPPATFEWIDDDLGQAHVSVVDHATGEVVVRGVVPVEGEARDADQG